MSKGLKVAIGVVAAIAIPFVAPMIAGAIGASAALAGTALGGFFATAAGAGTAAGSALIGAGLGAASAAATGRNPLLGAALGGVGGFAGGGGFSGLFGTGASAAGTGAAGATTGAAASAPAPVIGAGALAPVPAAMTAGAPLQLAGAGIGGAASTAPTAAGFSLSSLGSSLASAVNPSNLAQLSAVMYNVSNYNQLDAPRRAALQEAAELAATNRGLFEQRVTTAREMMQRAQANPQQAFAQTEMSVQRRLRDVTGAEPGAERKAAIEGTRLGVLAAEREQERSRGAMSSAAAMLPTQAPQGSAGTTYAAMAADINARGQLATQGANLVTRMFPNEIDRERERSTRTAGLFRTA